MTNCSCQTISVGDRELPDVVDVACPTHGFPRDEWYAGHPLRRHALEIVLASGELITSQEAHRLYLEELRRTCGWKSVAVPADGYAHRYRLERPSETYARLMAEHTVSVVP